MKIWLVVAIAVMGAALSGCGTINELKAHDEMEKTLAAYKTCLAANTSNPNACVAAKAAYDADLAAYKASNVGPKVMVQ